MKPLNSENPQEFQIQQIALAASGDQQAISQLYELTYNQVYRTVKSMVQDEDAVLDIVQDSYVKAFRSLDQLDKPENFCAWMKRIATNKAKDYFKKKRPILFSEMAGEDDEEIDFQDDRTENLPEEVIDRQETTRLINEILDSLSEEQRLVIGMFYYEQMSVREIAEILGCSENTVKSRLNYGRKKVEAKVLDLEKQGTKLYSLAPLPFLLWLFKMDAKAARLPAAVPPADSILSSLGSPAAGSAAAGSSQAAVSAGAKAAVGAGAKAAGAKALAAKIIAGLLAVSVVAGGVTVAVKSRSAGQPGAAGTTDVQGTETGEDQSFSESEIHDAYAYVIAQYQKGMVQDPEEIRGDIWQYSGQYAMYLYHLEPGCNFYYAYYDVNHDGRDELVTGFSTGEQIVLIEIYAYDGVKVHPLTNQPMVGTDKVTLQIMTDGSLYMAERSGDEYRYEFLAEIPKYGATENIVDAYVLPYGWKDNPESDENAKKIKEAKAKAEVIAQKLSQCTPVENFDWNLITAAETVPETESGMMAENAYEAVKNEYRKAMCAAEDTYKNLDYQFVNPELSALFYYYLAAPDFKFYTANYDINHDGTGELLIGFGAEQDIQVVDVYAFDGDKPVKLISQNALGSESARLQIMTDGTMYCSVAVDFSTSLHSLEKIAADGYSIEKIDNCSYNAGDDSSHLEAIKEKAAACTPVTDISWTLLTADPDVFGSTDADAAGTDSKRIVDEYREIYFMDHDEFNNDPAISERYPYLDSTMWFYHSAPDGFAGKQYYYANADVDGDGIPELLIGFGEPGDIYLCNSFAWNGTEMEHLGTEGKCEILADGTILDFIGNGGEIAGIYKLENSRIVENTGTEFKLGYYSDSTDYQNAVDAHGGYYEPEWSTLSDHHD